MKNIAKCVLPISWIALLPISLCSCSDHGYKFHYAVINGNGNIVVGEPVLHKEGELCAESPLCDLDCPENSRIFALRGSKNGTQEVYFIAEPEEGFKVKNWYFNGEIVADNFANSYHAKVTSTGSYNGVIAVEFVLI